MANRFVAVALSGIVAVAGCGGASRQTVTTAEAKSSVVRASVPAAEAAKAATAVNVFGFALLRPDSGRGRATSRSPRGASRPR